MPNHPEVVCFGSALLDLILPISEDHLFEIGGEKGGMELISEERYSSLKEIAKPIALSLGGSSLNVAKALSRSNTKVAFYGAVGNDPEGEWVLDELQDLNIYPLLTFSDHPTGSCLSFVTPDAKRTMRTFLGANRYIQFHQDQIDWQHVKLAHFEGYLVDRQDFLYAAIKEAKRREVLVSIDIGSFEVAKKYFHTLRFLLETAVDLLFCNEEEAENLTQGAAPEQACHQLSQKVPYVIVSTGASGGFVGSKEEIFHYEAIPTHVVDTTGAGDYFAAGFIGSFLKKKPLQECAKKGAELASHVISFFGT